MSARPAKIESIALGDLVPYPNNPRTHPPANVEKLAASLTEYGWTNPVLITAQNEIIAGHGRFLAAKQLGLTQAPCIRLKHLTADQVRAYRIADNRLGLDSDWDDDLLKLELADLDLDVALTGFDPDELDRILNGNSAREGEDETPGLQETAVSQTGDIWALGSHRLLCGDACDSKEVARLLSGVTPSVMVTDPPFGVDYDPQWRNDAEHNFAFRATKLAYMGSKRRGTPIAGDQRADWSAAFELVSAAVLYVWHADLHAKEVMTGLERIGYQIRAQLIWVKEHAAISHGHYSYQHEPCWYAVLKGKTANWHGGSYQSTVINAKMVKPNSGEDFVSDHGCQKPVELMRRPILNHTSEGQAVYDPFMGSGSTIIAAETINRVCYGVEINPLYVDMAIRRWQTFTGKTATRLADGKAFDG